ncbi:MAG: hypothetical protein L3J28_11915 [Candidatus Polarisedimenticolaceae bacterium]|nr:hypothetical protein [Candidatus Polarisedimenticolaceae bacterium]
MNSKRLETLCDFTTEAHARIQSNFAAINPVVGVSQKMRGVGVPADTMTIDCLKSKKRILIILHDHQPDSVRYQFTFIDRDPGETFETLPYKELSVNRIYGWIETYFQKS